MTVEKYIEKHGWDMKHLPKLGKKVRAMTIRIGFECMPQKSGYTNKIMDEFEVDVRAYEVAKLSKALNTFCEENDLKDIDVKYIDIVKIAGSLEELRQAQTTIAS